MYKVMLVDDEPWILKDLSSLINWGDFGFSIVCETTRPLEAIRLARKNKPDVIFTDISMPGLSGLDFAEQVVEALPDTQIVFISAYDDFDYTRQALHIRAFDYILKPVSRSALEDLLIKLRIQIESDRSRVAAIHKLERSYSLLNVIYAEEKDEIVARPLNDFLATGVNAVVAVIDGIMDEVTLFNALGEITASYAVHYMYAKVGKKRIFVIMQLGTRAQWLGIYRMAYRFTKTQGVTIGVSEPFSSSERLKSCCVHAEIAAEQRFFGNCNAGAPFFYRNPESAFSELMAEANAIAEKEKLEAFLDTLAPRLKGIKANTAQCYRAFCSLLMQISRCGGAAMEFEWEDRKDFLQAFGNIRHMAEFLKSGLAKEAVAEKTDGNTVVKEILEDVRRNFEKPLRFGEYADRYYLNICYLSQLFKKHTNRTFTNYLVSVRIQKAEELIRNTRMPLYEISEKVGYNDYYHFSKIFKKHKGVSPSDLRKPQS